MYVGLRVELTHTHKHDGTLFAGRLAAVFDRFTKSINVRRCLLRQDFSSLENGAITSIRENMSSVCANVDCDMNMCMQIISVRRLMPSLLIGGRRVRVQDILYIYIYIYIYMERERGGRSSPSLPSISAIETITLIENSLNNLISLSNSSCSFCISGSSRPLTAKVVETFIAAYCNPLILSDIVCSCFFSTKISCLGLISADEDETKPRASNSDFFLTSVVFVIFSSSFVSRVVEAP